MIFAMIFNRQLRETIGSFAYRAALIVLTVLIPLTAYIQANYYNRAIDDYLTRERIHETEKLSGMLFLTRPVTPLLPFFNGDYYRLTDEFLLRTDSVVLGPSGEDVAPLDQLFPRTDLSLLIGVVLTLVAMLIGHDAITGEKERGTLRLMLSAPVTRRAILRAKMAAIVCLLSAALVYAVALYLIMVRLFAGGTLAVTGGLLTELLLYALAALLALCVFAALGLALSSLVRSSTVALALCIAVWTTLVVIWPNVSPYLAASLFPTPTAQELKREVFFKEAELIRAEIAEHRQAASEMKAQGIDAFEAWPRYVEIRKSWLERKRNEIERLERQQEEVTRRQQSAAERLLRVSPYGTLREILSDLCGTGLEGYHDIRDKVARYYYEEFLPVNYEALAEEGPLKRLPTMRVPPPPSLGLPPLADRLREALPAFGLLAGEIVLAVGFCFWRFERYDPR